MFSDDNYGGVMKTAIVVFFLNPALFGSGKDSRAVFGNKDAGMYRKQDHRSGALS